MIRVVVTGVTGKMGREVLLALCRDPEVEPAGAVSRSAPGDSLDLPIGKGTVPLSREVGPLLDQTGADVLVDFTNVEFALPAAQEAIRRGVRPVIGTSGLSREDVDTLRGICAASGLGGIFAANFALGGIVMMHLAKIAARYFDYAEVLEMHHEAKADAPSGTAIATARAMAEARGGAFKTAPTEKFTLPGSRGAEVDGIPLHSLRLPGLLAHQEIVLGAAGQTLRIRHDTISRECYMPGVLLAVKEVMKRNEFVVGLDTLLGL
jgi:4-hydroxy-tetrahydrodipicolinate reductase